MKTYPILKENGELNGFEIGNTFISLSRIKQVLKSINGVSGVRATGGSDDRIMFDFGGESCVVHEPFGDNSRYWIGPAFPDRSNLDIKPIHQAFVAYEGPLVRALRGMRRHDA